MSGDRVLELFLFLLPAVVAGAIAFYFFRLHTKNEDNRRRFLLQKDAQKHAMPIRLQAYERMALFLERIVPSNLLIRVQPTSADKSAYEALLVKNIENEFDHNISQQIYMSDECWNVIKAAKNASIQMIRKSSMSNKIDSADKLREAILNDMLDKQPPSAAALSFVKKEVGDLW
jgi:RNase H-fold protein (predicted Holliday junction resolvase)